MAAAAVKAAGTSVWYAKELAIQVLSSDEFGSVDGDLWVPYLHTLDLYAAWGLLTFSCQEVPDPDGFTAMEIKIERKPICNVLVEKIKAIPQ